MDREADIEGKISAVSQIILLRENKRREIRSCLILQSHNPEDRQRRSMPGVFARAEKTEEVDEIYGALNGIEGIINDHLINLRHIIMNEEDKDLLMKTPSTILGSCRY